MEKQCCNFSVTELDDGFRIEVRGQDVKEMCKTMFEKCSAGGSMKDCFQMFGDSGKDKTCCQ